MAARLVVAAVVLAGCGLGATGPLRPPSVEDARALLDEIIDAGVDRDWERLCSTASGTCEGELAGMEDRAPAVAPRIADVEIVQPQENRDSWRSGGVRFVLCGVDGLGDPYESEVLVFNDGSRLIALAAVYWVGTKVAFAPLGGGGVKVGGEPSPGPSRC